MKLNIALVLSIILAVGIVALSFTFYQISSERDKLNNELEARMSYISGELNLHIKPYLESSNLVAARKYSDSLIKTYNLLGIVMYYNGDSIAKLNIKGDFSLSPDLIEQFIVADTGFGNVRLHEGKSIYQYIKSINNDGISNGVSVLYCDSEYIDNIINSIWFRNFWRWFLQALFVSFITLAIVKWGFFNPMNKIVEWVKAARSGSIEQLGQHPPASFLAPLHKEIVHIAKAMHEAKAIAEEEARLRERNESVWTPERLKVETENLLGERLMVVVSNREPYMHIHDGRKINCIVPASGMITAMEPILKSCGGLWIASGTGDADKDTVDKNDKVQVPPDNPRYTLRRLWLSKEEEDHFYYGFSNEGLWPLCHIAHTRPTFRKEDWDYYKEVNRKFAAAIIEEIKGQDQPVVLIQDYHFSLLPLMVKKERPDARVALFWHIPWPNPESFGICPWQKEILHGMLGADLLGFHTQYHCNNFLETVNSSLESVVNWDSFSVSKAGQTTYIKPFPISIDFTQANPPTNFKTEPSQILKEYGINAKFMGIGVDRIDYTKGLIEKFLSIERFFEKNPSYIGRFTFVQIGAPSRTLLKTYADMVSAVEKEAERINWKFKQANWKAILLLKRHHSHEEMQPFYASAQLCMVTSLHDGMNLVAKEFIATRTQNDGVLILSQFAGASHDLHGAVLVNPYDIELMADAIKDAIEMPLDQQDQRMQQMRQTVLRNNIYHWAANLLRTLVSIKN